MSSLSQFLLITIVTRLSHEVAVFSSVKVRMVSMAADRAHGLEKSTRNKWYHRDPTSDLLQVNFLQVHSVLKLSVFVAWKLWFVSSSKLFSLEKNPPGARRNKLQLLILKFVCFQFYNDWNRLNSKIFKKTWICFQSFILQAQQ